MTRKELVEALCNAGGEIDDSVVVRVPNPYGGFSTYTVKSAGIEYPPHVVTVQLGDEYTP